MSGDPSTLERLLLFAGEALQGLGERLQPEILGEELTQLGLRLPLNLLADPQVSGAASSAAAAAQGIGAVLDPLRQALDEAGGASAATVIAAGTAVATEIIATIASLRTLAGRLETAAASLPDPAIRARLAGLAVEIPKRLVERLVLEQLDERVEGLSALLAVLGLGEDWIDWGASGDPTQPAHRVSRLYAKRVGKLISDPSAHFRETFRWGESDFDATPLFERIIRWRQRREEPALLLTDRNSPPVSPPGLALGFIRLQTATETSPPGLAATWRDGVGYELDEEIELGETYWSAYLTSKSRFEAGLRAVLTPDGRLEVDALGDPKLSARAGLRMRDPAKAPIGLVGLAGGTRLEAREIDIAAVIEGIDSSPSIEVKLEGLNCILDVGGGDSFLKSLSGGGQGKSEISIGARWSPKTGLKFTGSAAFEIAIPTHARFGPATIETIYLVSGFAADAITLEISGAIKGELGPFIAVADRIGVEFRASFPENGGNIGPIQLDARFKPPSGLGLSLNGGGFSGGGFIRRDPANGEYGGALELSFQDFFQVKAFGVLNTRMPDGAETYSLAIVISAEFAPIQLSFGFTLLGVGGLLGVNRTALYDQLRLGLRDGSLESILFPRDLVANAPRIINDLKRMFPPQSGRFLIGPMGKLGWGSPALVTLDIGLILEIPRPGFVILGVLRVALPAKDAPVIDLQVNFLGVVDFEKKEISFDASLFDSRLLAFTLTGDMAVRIYWGDNANFLLTVGGFHPDYTPPPLGLPTLNRLAISMWAGNPRLSAEAYFAVTSNTVQFGAKVELYFGAKVFNVYGFIALDALIQFDPFHFVATIAGQVAVRSGGSTLFSIRLDLMLEGPTPWHAHGRGSFEIGFIFTVTISADFDITFGDDRNTSLPPVQLRSLIEEAFGADGAWRALAGPRPHVATRELAAEEGLVIPPMGGLIACQKAAPLNLPLSRVGARRIEGANRFSIVEVSLGAGSDEPAMAIVQEEFAAAQYLDLSDAEKLSRRSFEPFDAGVEIAGGTAPKADAQAKVDVAYEVIYVRKPRRRLLFRLRDAMLDLLVAGSAAGRCKLSAEKRAPTGLATPKVAMPTESFILAGADDLAPYGAATAYASQSAAHAALKDIVANDARLAGKLQVVSEFEAAA